MEKKITFDDMYNVLKSQGIINCIKELTIYADTGSIVFIICKDGKQSKSEPFGYYNISDDYGKVLMHYWLFERENTPAETHRFTLEEFNEKMGEIYQMCMKS